MYSERLRLCNLIFNKAVHTGCVQNQVLLFKSIKITKYVPLRVCRCTHQEADIVHRPNSFIAPSLRVEAFCGTQQTCEALLCTLPM